MNIDYFETMVQEIGEQQDIAMSSITPPQRQLCIVACGEGEMSEEVRYDVVHLSDGRIMVASEHTGDFFFDDLESALTHIHGDGY